MEVLNGCNFNFTENTAVSCNSVMWNSALLNDISKEPTGGSKIQKKLVWSDSQLVSEF